MIIDTVQMYIRYTSPGLHLKKIKTVDSLKLITFIKILEKQQLSVNISFLQFIFPSTILELYIEWEDVNVFKSGWDCTVPCVLHLLIQSILPLWALSCELYSGGSGYKEQCYVVVCLKHTTYLLECSDCKTALV